MSERHAHPRAYFGEALKAMNLGALVEPLARERLQYLASMEDNTVDIAMFRFAVEALIDETPGFAAAVAEHRARDAKEKAHRKTFGG